MTDSLEQDAQAEPELHGEQISETEPELRRYRDECSKDERRPNVKYSVDRHEKSPPRPSYIPKCIAQAGPLNATSPNFYHRAEWTADGNALVAYADDRKIRTYFMPDFAEYDPADEGDNDDISDENVRSLVLHSSLYIEEGLRAYALYPGFDLDDPTTTLVLTAKNGGVPIQLYNVVDQSGSKPEHASDEWETCVEIYALPFPDDTHLHDNNPWSLAFTSYRRFVAGFRDRLAVYDLERSGKAIRTHLTSPSRKKRKFEPLTGPRGFISSLAVQPVRSSDGESYDRGLLAAGTYNGEVGLFPSGGMNPSFARLNVKEDGKSTRDAGCYGVSSIVWSPCGIYLYVAERNSDSILIYDTRRLDRVLGRCTGRKAQGPQRLGFDVYHNGYGDGHDVVAGASDGNVAMWRNPHLHEEAAQPDCLWKLHNNSAVGSVVAHPCVDLYAVCSGSRNVSPLTRPYPPSSDAGSSSRSSDTMGSLDINVLSEGDSSMSLSELAPSSGTSSCSEEKEISDIKICAM